MAKSPLIVLNNGVAMPALGANWARIVSIAVTVAATAFSGMGASLGPY